MRTRAGNTVGWQYNLKTTRKVMSSVLCSWLIWCLLSCIQLFRVFFFGLADCKGFLLKLPARLKSAGKEKMVPSMTAVLWSSSLLCFDIYFAFFVPNYVWHPCSLCHNILQKITAAHLIVGGRRFLATGEECLEISMAWITLLLPLEKGRWQENKQKQCVNEIEWVVEIE